MCNYISQLHLYGALCEYTMSVIFSIFYPLCIGNEECNAWIIDTYIKKSSLAVLCVGAMLMSRHNSWVFTYVISNFVIIDTTMVRLVQSIRCVAVHGFQGSLFERK